MDLNWADINDDELCVYCAHRATRHDNNGCHEFDTLPDVDHDCGCYGLVLADYGTLN